MPRSRLLGKFFKPVIYYTRLYDIKLYYTVRSSIRYFTIIAGTKLDQTILYYTILYYTIYSTILSYAVLNYTTLHPLAGHLTINPQSDDKDSPKNGLATRQTGSFQKSGTPKTDPNVL